MINDVSTTYDHAPKGGSKDPAPELPSWHLSLRSPYAADQTSSSWFGGTPKMPAYVLWPRDKDGKPLAFVAQFDLAAMPEEKHVSLPKAGALLIFGGFRVGDAAVLVLSEAEMRAALHQAAPEDEEHWRTLSLSGLRQPFPHWPLDLRYAIDAGEERTLIDPEPQDWITTWGIALAEAEVVTETLEYELREKARHEAYMAARDETSKKLTYSQREKQKYFALFDELVPPFLEDFEAFINLAASMPREAPMDRQVLADICARRKALSDDMGGVDPHEERLQERLIPSRRWLVEKLLRKRTLSDSSADRFEAVPPSLRGVVAGDVEGYRYHRLFGRATPPSNVQTDLRGMDCLITFFADDLLDTQSEHSDGFSIWCPREDMAAGDFSNGKLVWHINC